MAEWTQELKDEVIAAYKGLNPTPETSVEIIKELAEQFEPMTANGIRMVLVQTGNYVKKDVGAASKTSTAKEGDAPKRVSKESSIAALTKALTDAGATVDSEILDKLTGKAAVYFAAVIKTIKTIKG